MGNDNFNKINLERYKNGKIATETFLKSLQKLEILEREIKNYFYHQC